MFVQNFILHKIKDQSGKLMRFSFVFSLIFQNPTLCPHTSILTNYSLLVALKAKYQNDPNKVKKCHMFQVIEMFQARGISKYFCTGLKEHTVVWQCLFGTFLLKQHFIFILVGTKSNTIPSPIPPWSDIKIENPSCRYLYSQALQFEDRIPSKTVIKHDKSFK